jgi:hypothetical protein
MGQLPKSVKVRSTCNACQQAKIRCSHEKPSCRRCQKHKIECIYSVSRRLGRPAKKKDQKVSSESQSQSPVLELTDPSESEKKPRKPGKRKSPHGSNPISSSRARSGRNAEKEIDEDRLPTALAFETSEDQPGT